MTTLPDRPHTALIVIDVQKGVMAEAYEHRVVISNIGVLVEKARAEGAPIVWVQHSDEDLVKGSEEWKYVDELSRRDAEPVVDKRYGDAFEGTDLEAVLANAGVGRLIVAGAETDACIRSTIHGAFTRGYDVTVVGDAHSTNDLTAWGAPPPDVTIAHLNLYWQFQRAPGRTAGVEQTKDVTFSG